MLKVCASTPAFKTISTFGPIGVFKSHIAVMLASTGVAILPRPNSQGVNRSMSNNIIETLCGKQRIR